LQVIFIMVDPACAVRDQGFYEALEARIRATICSGRAVECLALPVGHRPLLMQIEPGADVVAERETVPPAGAPEGKDVPRPTVPPAAATAEQPSAPAPAAHHGRRKKD